MVGPLVQVKIDTRGDPDWPASRAPWLYVTVPDGDYSTERIVAVMDKMGFRPLTNEERTDYDAHQRRLVANIKSLTWRIVDEEA